uniref:C2H2-type domain-containing protein n=1 Tax=Lutzomyia longipalpis TaxID=7200 RepID=A0A1B0CQ06_LUTLO
MQSPNATAGKTFSVGDKGAAAAAGAKRRPQICEMCGKVVSNITQHLKHHDKEKEMCQVCSRPVRKVLRHRHSCNLKLYGCSCGVSFALKGEIEAHMREYGSTKESHKFQCRRCPALLASTDEFDGHLAAVHKILICLQCYKQFLTPEALAVHIENHAVREVIKCTICSVELASRESLNRHVNNIHLTQEKIVCPLCCTSFTAKDNLRRHIEAVHGDRKDFICTVCGKLFSQASSVTRHMVIHSDLRPFRCAFCFQSFKLPRDLRKHNAAHREFMIRCPSCESFHLNQQELSLHLKRHPSHRKFGEGGYLTSGEGKSSKKKSKKIHLPGPPYDGGWIRKASPRASSSSIFKMKSTVKKIRRQITHLAFFFFCCPLDFLLRKYSDSKAVRKVKPKPREMNSTTYG